MSETMLSPNEYMQFYQKSMNDEAIAYGGSPDATTSHALCDGIYSPSISCSSTHQLSPSKGCASKPIRRRSRASKKTPITLLNANPKNFRALVQQFTGCPSTALSFGGHKGPVNLNFEQGVKQNQSANSYAMPSAYNYYNQESQMLFQQQEKHRQILQGQNQQYQEVYYGQQSGYSCDSVARSSAVLSTSSDHRSSVEHPDDDFENINLCELIEDTFMYDSRG